MSEQKQNSPVASIALPSADLISYRFDQNDKNFADLKSANTKQFDTLNEKLDIWAGKFQTKEDAATADKAMETQHREDIVRLQTQIDDFKKSVKWWISTIIAIMGVLVMLYAIHSR